MALAVLLAVALLLLPLARAQPASCDGLVPNQCLLPFPSSFWTVPVRAAWPVRPALGLCSLPR